MPEQDQPDHDEIIEAAQAEAETQTWGQVEGLTWGDLAPPSHESFAPAQPAPAPSPEQHVVGGGVCSCPDGPGKDIGLPEQRDVACPTHGRGPQTPDELDRVAKAFATQNEGGELPPVEGRFVAPQPPVDGVASAEIPQTHPTEAEVLNELADKEIVEATPEDLQGNVYTLREKLLDMVTRGARRWAQNERCTVDVLPMLVPGQDGSPMVGATIYHEIPGMVLGETISNAMIVPSVLNWDQNWVDTQMRQIWEQARQQRSAQPEQIRAQQQNAQAARAAMGNGHTPPGGGSGLIIPGM